MGGLADARTPLARMRRNRDWVIVLLPCLMLHALLPLTTMVSAADGKAVLCSLAGAVRGGQHADRWHSGSAEHAGWRCPCLLGGRIALPAVAPAVGIPAPLMIGLVSLARPYVSTLLRWHLPVARGPPRPVL
jgi:hypothetical protein